MEKEADEQLYNYTDCLRTEYKDLTKLKGSFECLDIYINNRLKRINQYDNTSHKPKEAESPKENAERVYIDNSIRNYPPLSH
ncbi:hypothetical protein [Serratia sp. DD3]|uniref:hypothetical protein n=1 Tax=Serratia sp. DD3 TaxID=1410619 RepID=UPI0003C50B23|nr:hypothetical protein [Serratia sp. DD3]KEY59307.1 hypothetical protein SRDD_15870 [Serratia sp. DD3]